MPNEFLPWLITAFTVIAVYGLNQWENKYLSKLFDWLPAILLAYVIPAVISAIADLNYANHTIHQVSRHFFIPLAIITVMSSLSLLQLKAIGWKPIIIFVGGSLWIALFPVLAIYLFNESDLVVNLFIEQNYWTGLPPIVGSWIGGSTSQLVLKELVNCPENIFLTILVLDNILVNIWTILMFQSIKRSELLNKWLGIHETYIPEKITDRSGKNLSPLLCLLILVLSSLILTSVVHDFVLQIVLLSVMGLLFSNFIPGWNMHFVLKLGSILIIIVMAVLGLKLTFTLFKLEFGLWFFLALWLLSHFVFMLILAKILKVHTAWVTIASMANVGGIATAPAVTAAFEQKWMPHAVILAILSMATGTFWGMLTIYLLGLLLGN